MLARSFFYVLTVLLTVFAQQAGAAQSGPTQSYYLKCIRSAEGVTTCKELKVMNLVNSILHPSKKSSGPACLKDGANGCSKDSDCCSDSCGSGDACGAPGATCCFPEDIKELK
jgi:hypothetical protein